MTRPTVLVADPDPGIRLLIRRVLRRAGFGVTEAAALQEALSSVALLAPVAMVVATDLDGEDVTAMLGLLGLARGAAAHAPVLYLLPPPFGEYCAFVRDYGLGECLAKPLSHRDIGDALDRLMAGINPTRTIMREISPLGGIADCPPAQSRASQPAQPDGR